MMKTVGIVTLYKVRNLGACLQAVATKMVLEECGFKGVYVRAYGWKLAWELFKGDMGALRPWNLLFLFAKDRKFRNFFTRFEEISIEDVKKVEGIIIGSDSIWISRYGKCSLQNVFWGNIDCENLRAYAPSVGGSYDIKDYDISVVEGLKKLRSITVRDKLTQKFVKQCTGYVPEIVLDPTLLVDWEKIVQFYTPREKSKYIVIYGPLTLEVLGEIKKFAKKKKCKLINIGSFNRRIRCNKAVDPYEFIAYLVGAEYVFTSMFHGVMISVSLNKNFKYMPIMKNRTEKLESVFEILNLDATVIYDNCLDESNQFEWKKNIDYTFINRVLSVERKKVRKMFTEWFGE